MAPKLGFITSLLPFEVGKKSYPLNLSQFQGLHSSDSKEKEGEKRPRIGLKMDQHLLVLKEI